MPQNPPQDLQKAPRSWKEAFKQLREYAVRTGIEKVIVTETLSDGSVRPAQVDLEQTPTGVIVRITL